MPFGIPNPRAKFNRPTAGGTTKSLVKKRLSSTVKRGVLLSPVGIFFIALAVALFSIVFIPILIFGEASQNPVFAVQYGLDGFFGNTTEPTITQPPPPPPIISGTPSPIPDCSQIDSSLLNDFNVRVSGQEATCNVKQIVYGFYSIPFRSPEYARNLKTGSPFSVIINLPDQPGRCHGLGNGKDTITMWGFMECYIQSEHGQRIAQFLIHETGHIMRYKNYREFGVLYAKNLPGLIKQDPTCYNQGYLKTYSLRCGSACGIIPSSEDFAESSAVYVYNGKPVTTGDGIPIVNLKASCPATYNYFKDNVFGGTEF